jgi:MerR family transcriptional regulator, copper efflux regulator
LVGYGLNSKVKGVMLRIGELASGAGISRDAVRFYERLGLIASKRTRNGYREFPDEMLQQLLYIRTAQSLGFSLSEIGSGLTQLLRGGSTPQDARRVLLEKIAMIDQRIADLRALRKELHARTRLDCPFALRSATVNRVSRGRRTPPDRGPHQSPTTSGENRRRPPGEPRSSVRDDHRPKGLSGRD